MNYIPKIILFAFVASLLLGCTQTKTTTEKTESQQEKNVSEKTNEKIVEKGMIEPSTEKNVSEKTNEKIVEKPTVEEKVQEKISDASIPEEKVQEKMPEMLVESSAKTCSFNSDCPTAERCECSEVAGCFCKQGKRGVGKSGVNPCVDGNDCDSALCIEGSDGLFYCSGECKSDADCQSKLPLCSYISFVGQVCIRKKP